MSVQPMVSLGLAPIVFRFGRLGDMVMLTSLLQILRARYGKPCELYAAGPWNEALYAGNPEISRLWSLPRHTPIGISASWWRAWWRLLSSGDRPVYVSENRPRQLRRIRRLLWLAGVKQERCVFITDMPGDIHAHWLDRLVQFGARTPASLSRLPVAASLVDRVWRPQIHLLPGELTAARAWLALRGVGTRKIILIQPGNFRTRSAGHGEPRHRDDKAWPLTSWVLLLQRIARERPDAEVLVCGAPKESTLVTQIVAAVRHERVASAVLPLRPFLSLCRLADSMISIDTGPAHVAAALGVPVTVMYGSESPATWLPVSGDGSAVSSVGGPPRSRVSDVSIDEVFACWQGIVGTRADRAAPGNAS